MGKASKIVTFDLVIENAKVLTMDAQSTVLDDSIIGVTGGVITLLEKRRPDVQYRAKETIDAQGMVAFPGFVNTHVHCFQSLLKGLGADMPLIGWLNSSVQPFGVRVTHRQQELATLLACLEALKGGCTTLLEFFYTNQDPELADVCIEAMRSTGVVVEKSAVMVRARFCFVRWPISRAKSLMRRSQSASGESRSVFVTTFSSVCPS